MKNTVVPDSSKDNSHWSPEEVVEQEAEKENRLMRWWYNLTSLPDAPENASFVQRETARKSQLLSVIVFWLLIIFLLFMPACFVVPNHYIIFADVGMLVVCVVSLWFNRTQRPQLAGLLLTTAFELALTMVIFTTRPLDEASIQQYELYVFGELLCVSLLVPGSVFVVMAYNILMITISLLWQPHAMNLAVDLQTQFVPIFVRPVGVQFLVAFVSFLWVKGAVKALDRADRAEMVARLEHEISDQRRELEEGIEQILQTHVAVANGNLNARAPLNQSNALWQIARALNTLLVRLQRASQAEKDLQRVEYAVASSVQMIQKAEQMKQLPSIPFTQTAIDPLIVALQGKTISYIQPQQLPHNLPANAIASSTSETEVYRMNHNS
jgi:hypothetical protein